GGGADRPDPGAWRPDAACDAGLDVLDHHFDAGHGVSGANRHGSKDGTVCGFLLICTFYCTLYTLMIFSSGLCVSNRIDNDEQARANGVRDPGPPPVPGTYWR